MEKLIDLQLQKIRDTQRESWNNASAGWKKWDSLTMEFMKPVGDAMIGMLQLSPDASVLDIATGTGEPGLSIAALLPNSKVIGTDIAENMLSTAEEHARLKRLDNFQTYCCDVSALPFANNSFDAVSSRFGLMFFPDLELAMTEMLRVLKPAGRIALAVWHEPHRNSWITTSMGTMITMLGLQIPSAGAPGLFRCANEQQMWDLCRHNGLKDIHFELVENQLTFESFEKYWQFVSEVASPNAFKSADAVMKNKIKVVLQHKMEEGYCDTMIVLSSSAIVIGGMK